MQITWFYCLWHVYKGTKPLDTICLVLCAPRPSFSWPSFSFSSIYLAWNRINLHVSHIFIIPVNWNFGPVWFFFLPIALFCIAWKRPTLRNKRRNHAEKNVRGFMQQSRNNAFSLNYILFTVCVCASFFCALWLMGLIVYDGNTTRSSVLNKFCKTFGKVKCSM